MACGYCGAARKGVVQAAKAIVRGDVREAVEQAKVVKDNLEQKVKSESDRIRKLRVK